VHHKSFNNKLNQTKTVQGKRRIDIIFENLPRPDIKKSSGISYREVRIFVLKCNICNLLKSESFYNIEGETFYSKRQIIRIRAPKASLKSFTLKILIFDHSLELDDSFNLADVILERDEKILFEPVECISSGTTLGIC
jgi:hypothetical protein